MTNVSKQLYEQRNASRVPQREFQQCQDQLVQVLAHRLVDLGDRLSVLEAGTSKRRLIQAARQQWNLPASFVWTDSIIPPAKKSSTETDTTNYEVRSLCWKGSELENQRESSPVEWWQTTASPAPLLGESQQFRLDCVLSLARNATTCTRCGNTYSEDLVDGICSLCACIPQEDWEMPFEWTAQGNSTENICGSPNNTDVSYTLNPNSTNEDWMFRDSSTSEGMPAGESSFDIQSAPSLEMPRHVYPTMDREQQGFHLSKNDRLMWRHQRTSKSPTPATYNMPGSSHVFQPPSSKPTQGKTPVSESGPSVQYFGSRLPGYINDQSPSASSLEMPRHIYPRRDRERQGFRICANGHDYYDMHRRSQVLYLSPSQPTQETPPQSASRCKGSPLKRAITKFRAYFI